MTSTEFDTWITLPENYDHVFELIGGNPIIKHPTNAYDSMIGSRILGFMGIYMMKHDIGYLTSAKGGYCVGDERYVPDGALVLYERQKSPDKSYYNSVPPNWVMEVISEETDVHELHWLIPKIGNYHHAGCIVWIVDNQNNCVEVYEKGQPVKIYTVTDTLTIPALLPNFELPLKAIFVTQSD